MTDEENSADPRDGISSELADPGERLSPSRMTVARERAAAVKDHAVQAKERTLASAREQLQDSIESGRAEKVGHSTIDALAKGAAMGVPLLPLPLGTRRAGKLIGKRLIGRLQDASHDRLSASLTAADSALPIQSQSARLSRGENTSADADGADAAAARQELTQPARTAPTPLAAWHPDPWDESLQRYHDGTRWSGHTAPG
jgi:Protein of unknown function (DUF2510)